MKSDVQEMEKSTWVTRLERNQKDLIQLKTKLNSYTCEPKTYSLFERIETLRSKLDSMSEVNNEIIESLKRKKKNIVDYKERAKQQFIAFNELHDGIEEYVKWARNC